MVVVFAGTQGYLDDLKVTDIRAFEDGLYEYFAASQDALLADLTERSNWTTISATGCTRR